MVSYKKYFQGKRVTVVGLGLLGKRLGDIAFLAECGARVTVTDLKYVSELKPSLDKLKKYKTITYVLGKHRFEDFENKDFILKGQGVALDSPYIAHAREKGIPIEMDESLFAKLAPEVKIIGVTGTRGKSTVTELLYRILLNAGVRVHLGGNVLGTAALPLLKKVKPGDIALFELSSWQLQGFGEAEISPSIAVFTNFMPDHMNYYSGDMDKYFLDKSYIYKFQKPGDALVINKNLNGKIPRGKYKTIVADPDKIPTNWKVGLLGAHNAENIALALAVARLLEIPENIIKKTVEKFSAMPGRLEHVRKYKGIKIYNDTNSTTPEATVAALNSFEKPVILILGGADKKLPIENLLEALPKKTMKIYLLPGDGSDRIKGVIAEKVPTLEEALKRSIKVAHERDVILFSPGFASFNMFKNEYDRGEKFLNLVKKLK
jgi:UDP-N-acetylmuramoylalanine--D-glutamate ligase